jgi:hypothetical protein
VAANFEHPWRARAIVAGCGAVAIILCMARAAGQADTAADQAALPADPAGADLTLPPRITTEPGAPGDAASAIAAAQVTDSDELEEIVVISDQNPWRLPDLGSSWRSKEAEQDAASGRITADLLPLWNPDAEESPTRNPFAVTDDFTRVGFIEVFRIRFGGR